MSTIPTIFYSIVVVSDMLEQLATEEEQSKVLNISDYHLFSPSERQIRQMIIAKNPLLQHLIDAIDLDLINTQPMTETTQIKQN